MSAPASTGTVAPSTAAAPTLDRRSALAVEHYRRVAAAWTWKPGQRDGVLVFDHRPLPSELPRGGANVSYPSGSLSAALYDAWRGRKEPDGDLPAIEAVLTERFPLEPHDVAGDVARMRRGRAMRERLRDAR